MLKLWEDLKYRPVVVFGLAAAAVNGVAATVDAAWLQGTAAALTAAGAFYTQRRTASKKHLADTGQEAASRRARGL